MRYGKHIVENNSKITIFYEILTKSYEKISNYHKKLGWFLVATLYGNRT